MKQSFIALICFVILFLNSACNHNTEPEADSYTQLYGNADVVWDAPHTALLCLRGNVSEVIHSEVYDDYSMETVYRFDTQGRLTFFNPTGVNETPSSADKKQRSPWGPSGTVAYQYHYDEKGRLTSITELEHMIPVITYFLQYGSHGKYIPLPLSLGGLPLYLIKDLVSVTSDNGSLEYSTDGETASFESRQWLNSIVTTYVLSKKYPTKRTVVVSRGETIIQKEETIFAFGEHGFPLGMTHRTYEEDSETAAKEVTETTAFPFILPATQKVSLGLSTVNYNWHYTDYGQLIGAQAKANNGSGTIEITNVTISNALVDEQHNWTSMKRVINGYFNDYWAEGETRFEQSIKYYK